MAEINPSKTIVVSYDMYTEFEGERELVEQATAEHPFQFTTGLGFTFEAFEEKFLALGKNEIRRLENVADFGSRSVREFDLGRPDFKRILFVILGGVLCLLCDVECGTA